MFFLQIYDQDSKKYIYQDKYFGFELDDKRFKEELSKFVHSGNQLRKDVVICFVRKLQELYQCLEKQDKLRFFSSSLLLIYEGHQSEWSKNLNGDCTASDSSISNDNELNGEITHTPNEKANVKMIDFARSFHYPTKALPVGVDESYLLGLRNLIKMFKELLLEEEESHQQQ